MTEQEYADIGDLVSIGHVIVILRSVDPEKSSVVELEDYQKVMKILNGWFDKLFLLKEAD